MKKLMLVLMLGLSACAKKQDTIAPQQNDPNELKQPSISICHAIEANQTETIFVQLPPQILMLSGKTVYFIDKDGNFAGFENGTIAIGTFCTLTVVNQELTHVGY